MIQELKIIRQLLNCSEAAEILNVSRPTIYAWMDGQEPTRENALSVYTLAAKFKKFLDAEIDRADKFIKRPIFDGLSLLEHIKRGTDTETQIAELKIFADKEALLRRNKKDFGTIVNSKEMIPFNSPVYMSDYD